jgi:hypothetical protein
MEAMAFKTEEDAKEFQKWWEKITPEKLAGIKGSNPEDLTDKTFAEKVKDAFVEDMRKEDEELQRKKIKQEQAAALKAAKDEAMRLYKQNDDLVEKMTKAEKARALQELAGAVKLANPGISDPVSVATQLMSGNGDVGAMMTSSFRAFMLKPENSQYLKYLSPQAMAELAGTPTGTPPTNDFMVQYGADGAIKFSQRIDPNDTVVAAKPGGALDKASRRGGGSGGVTNVFHLYGNGPSVLAMIEKAQRAGLLS